MLDKYDHNLLLAYLEDELPPGEAARVEAMLAEDAALGRLISAMKSDREALRRLPVEQVPASLMEQVNLRLERQMLLDEPIPFEETVRTHKTFRLHRALIYSGLAALVLLSAGVVLQTLWPGAIGGTQLALPGHPAEREGAMALREGQVSTRNQAGESTRRGLDGLAMKAQPMQDAAALSPPGEPGPPLRESSQVGQNEKETLKQPDRWIAPSAPTAAASASAPAASSAEVQPKYFARLVPVQQGPTDPHDEIAQTHATPRESALTTVLAMDPQPAPVVLHVNTTDMQETRRQLLAWARDHRAQVILVDTLEATSAPPTSAAPSIPESTLDKLAAFEARETIVAERAAEPAASESRRNEPAVREAARPVPLSRSLARQNTVETPMPDDPAVEHATRDRAAPQQMLVVVQGRQLPQLLAKLNAHDQQLADVVPSEPEAEAEAWAARRAESTGGTSSPLADASASSGSSAKDSTPPSELEARADTPRMTMELSNGWGRLLQPQLPLSPRTALLGEDDALLLPVWISEDPSRTTDPAE